MTDRSGRTWPFLGGFILSVNLYILPWSASSPRATDLGGLILGAWVLTRLARGRYPARYLGVIGLLALIPSLWLFFNLLDNDAATVVMTARWLLALPWAMAFFLLQDVRTRQDSFAWGLLTGGIVNTGVILLQQLGFQAPLQMMGLSSSGANYTEYVSHQLRIPGLHGQHNASSAVTSLLIPSGFFLYFKGRLKLPWLLVSIFCLLVTLHLTSTRSPLVVTAATIIFASVTARRFRLAATVGIILVGVVGPLVLVYGPPGGWARWRNTEAMASNANEREDSNWMAIELSLDHPLGLDTEKGHRLLEEKTGIRSTHDAFLQAALTWSIPFGLLLLGGMTLAVARGAGDPGGPMFLPGLLAFHIFGLFLFEEHLNNPTFIILTTWLVALAFTPGLRPGRSSAGGSSDSRR